MPAPRSLLLTMLAALVVAVALSGCSVGFVITNSPDIPSNSPPRPY